MVKWLKENWFIWGLVLILILAGIATHIVLKRQRDDAGLSREQQIKLMTECTQDAEQVAAHNPGEKYHLSSLMPITTIAVAFFEYRTQ